jgi:hypothetical protein
MPNDPTLVRSAIQAMLVHVYVEYDSILWVVDTNCTDTSSGFKKDFKPRTLKEFSTPRPMDGAGGMLYATHEGTVCFEVLP